MVQIIEPTRLSNELGQALQQGAARGSEQAVNRNQLQQALGNLKNLPDTATPFERMSALISATAGIPGSERYVGQLMPFMMKQQEGIQAQQTPPVPGQTPQGNGTGNIQSSDPTTYLRNIQQQNNVSLPEPMQRPDVFGGALDPTELGLGPIPPQYSPEQIQEVEKQDAGLPNGSVRAKLMEDYNTRSREATRDLVSAAQLKSDIATRRTAQQTAADDALKARIGNQTPNDFAVAARMMEEQQRKNPVSNLTLASDRAAKEFENYQAGKDEFKRASVRPNPILDPENYEKQIKNLKSKAKDIIDWGQRDVLDEYLANNNWSLSEADKILNPLTETQSKEIASLPSLRRPVGGMGRAETGVPGVSEKAYRKELDMAASVLEKVIKPGKPNPKSPDSLLPGTSLVLVRSQLMKKGMGSQAFDTLISTLQNEGKLKLDSNQEKQLKMMSSEPSRVLSLYEYLFGAE